jgi:ketosteroid isomerase-like protein
VGWESHDVKHAESSAFETATAAFHQALRTNDSQALFAYVADDVLLMPPGEDAVRGKDAMRGWYAAFSQYRTSSLTLSDREVLVSELWAVELGSLV